MMKVEMADTKQHTYFKLPQCHDTDTRSRLPNLPATTPNGRARRITIVEGGYVISVCFEVKVKRQGKGRVNSCQKKLT